MMQVNERIWCGKFPDDIQELRDKGVKFVFALDWKAGLVTGDDIERIVRHIPNPYRYNAPPDWSACDMNEMRETARMIVSKSHEAPVFFHCWKGKDRTGRMRSMVEAFLDEAVLA